MNTSASAVRLMVSRSCRLTPTCQTLQMGRTAIAPLCSSGLGSRLRRRNLSSVAVLDESDEGGDDVPKARRRRRRERPPPITMTERAGQHIEQLMSGKPGKVGVRLGVKRRGCNGLSYTMKYADEVPPKDEVVTTAGGAQVFVDPMATLYVAGTVMDWEETELSAEFTFTNPNAKGSCGCGESFNV
ncbi:unnamed protein product [Choristocarpus tenellus]